MTEKGSKGRFYDLKIRYQRSDLDGTLFEGQVDTSIRLYGWITAQQGVRDITDIMEKYRRGALGLCLIRN